MTCLHCVPVNQISTPPAALSLMAGRKRPGAGRLPVRCQSGLLAPKCYCTKLSHHTHPGTPRSTKLPNWLHTTLRQTKIPLCGVRRHACARHKIRAQYVDYGKTVFIKILMNILMSDLKIIDQHAVLHWITRSNSGKTVSTDNRSKRGNCSATVVTEAWTLQAGEQVLIYFFLSFTVFHCKNTWETPVVRALWIKQDIKQVATLWIHLVMT